MTCYIAVSGVLTVKLQHCKASADTKCWCHLDWEVPNTTSPQLTESTFTALIQ